MTETEFIEALRQAKVPPARPEFGAALAQPPKRRSSRAWIALPATAAAALAVLYIGLKPQPSLAQIAAEAGKQQNYTIANTRILGNGKTSQTVSYRRGSLWRQGPRYGLPDHVAIVYDKIPEPFTLLDTPEPPQQMDFRVEHLLIKDAPVKVERGVDWEGRRVDRFTLHTTYRDRIVQTFDEVVIADPDTKLPIRVTIMRDNSSWGDQWDYDFHDPDAKLFEPPATKLVYDLPKQRKEVASAFAAKRVAVISGGMDGTVVLFETPKRRARSGSLQIGGKSYRGELLAGYVIDKRRDGSHFNWQPMVFPFGSRVASAFYFPNLRLKQDSLTGIAKIDGVTKRLAGAPVILTGSTLTLARTLMTNGTLSTFHGDTRARSAK